MRRLSFILIVAFAVDYTVADTLFTTGLPSRTPGDATARAGTYVLDDGSSENSVGLTSGGTFGFANQFVVAAGLDQLTGISVAWGSPALPGKSGLVANQAFKVYVWQDGNGDADPTNAGGAPLLASATGNVVPGSVDADLFQTVPIAVNLTGITSFYVGVEITHPAATFPAALDQTTAQGRSWIVVGAPFPTDLSGAVRLGDVAAPGNWLVRAEAVPEPTALLGTIALALVAWRRALR